ncbi:suppressor of mec-8 and unc-52 protein-like protein 2 [Iris pallida]|uniref:Suppressor of mec-8 and unc-52 protein-like protein 2 n=1 Tax=Iris pallida TaxID=29817 RepID=A0AAX6GRL6_IRIPA|nr:suppressor of mec-8 and unc-52 protein-like protein 2 [Iris pallida]
MRTKYPLRIASILEFNSFLAHGFLLSLEETGYAVQVIPFDNKGQLKEAFNIRLYAYTIQVFQVIRSITLLSDKRLVLVVYSVLS